MILLLLALVVGFFLIRARLQKQQVNSANAGTWKGLLAVFSSNAVADNRAVSDSGGGSGSGSGISGPPVILTRTQCNQIARGRCGRRRLIGKRKNAIRQCWSDVRSSLCHWSGADLDSAE